MRLNVDSLQLLSTGLGVKELVVVSGPSPPLPDDDTWNDDEKSLVLNSSEDVEDGIVSNTLEWSLSEWRNGVGGDTLLWGGTQGSPPSHVSLSVWSTGTHFVCVVSLMLSQTTAYW